MLRNLLTIGIIFVISVVFVLPAEGAKNKQVKADSTEVVQDSLKRNWVEEITSFHKPFSEKIAQSEFL